MKLLDILFKPKRSTYEFRRDENGKHQIGGDVPKDFTMPENQFMTDFQYLGFIDNSDELFSWIPFKVHLVCPIYLDIDKVFLDYSNPQSPVLISPVDPQNVTSAYDDLDRSSVVIYEPVKVKPKQVESVDEFNCIGIAGQPAWLQQVSMPRCPKSGRPMKFLCTLMSFGDIKTRFTNVVSKYPDFNQMTFWGDGNLYVFIEPKSNTVCYFIQNT
jgi:hypothetical protein